MTWSLKQDPSGLQVRWSDEAAKRYLEEGHWRNETLVDAARRAVQEQPDRPLLIEGETVLTRIQAWNKARQLAAYFADEGLGIGDVISFQLPNWQEAAIIALAARMMGIIINPIPPIYRGAELQYILADCGAKMIFVPETFRRHDFTGMLAELQRDLPELKTIVTLRGEGSIRFEDIIDCPPLTEQQLPAVDPANVMMIMYTSGTTGKPKGVLHTHYSFDYRVRGMGDAWSIGPQDVVFMPSPISHITGAFWAFDMPWVFGSQSVLLDLWTGEEGIAQIEKYGCTVSGGATPFLRQMLDSCIDRPEALSSLRLFFCGGTTVSPDLIKEADRKFPGCLFFRVYGSTEHTTATVGIRSREQAKLGAETDGEIIYPTELRIVSEDNTSLAKGEEGEILLRGPEQFAGYLHPEDNIGAFEDDGFFHMGDLGRLIHDNYLVITGRTKDIIIRSGENISPKEVEDHLFNHPSVAEVAIVAMPSPTTGEQGCAFVIPREHHRPELADLTHFLDGVGLAKQKYPEYLVLVNDLPRVPSGKVKKEILKQQAREIAERLAND